MVIITHGSFQILSQRGPGVCFSPMLDYAGGGGGVRVVEEYIPNTLLKIKKGNLNSWAYFSWKSYRVLRSKLFPVTT